MDFIKKLFETKETKLVLSELEDLNYFFESDSINTYAFSYTWELVYKETKRKIFTNSKLITKKLKNKELKPNILLFDYVLKITESAIICNHHNHKERWITNSPDNVYKIIFLKILHKLKENNVLENDDVKRVRKELEENINYICQKVERIDIELKFKEWISLTQPEKLKFNPTFIEVKDNCVVYGLNKHMGRISISIDKFYSELEEKKYSLIKKPLPTTVL